MGGRLQDALPELHLVVAEDAAQVEQEILDAAAYGTLPEGGLEKAKKLRWLQAPAAAPPAGYYTPELIEHPAVVTNFRGIYNDHIGAHIMAFVLAFARGFQHYLPRQISRSWTPRKDAVPTIHLPEATALIIGVVSAPRRLDTVRASAYGSSASTPDAKGHLRALRSCTVRKLWARCCPTPTS